MAPLRSVFSPAKPSCFEFHHLRYALTLFVVLRRKAKWFSPRHILIHGHNRSHAECTACTRSVNNQRWSRIRYGWPYNPFDASKVPGGIARPKFTLIIYGRVLQTHLCGNIYLPWKIYPSWPNLISDSFTFVFGRKVEPPYFYSFFISI